MTTEASIADITKFLQEVLGGNLVAYMTDVDRKTVSRWTSGTNNPRPEAERRLRTAFWVFHLLQSRDSRHTVRAWFIGLNPQLDDVSPVAALRAGNEQE